MYSTTKATVNNEEFTSSYMPVGINNDVTLKEVNVKKSTTGKDFLEIIFENSAGQTVSMTEWKNEKNMWIKTDEDLQHRDNMQFGRILQILNCYYPSIEPTELSTFADMINWVKSKLDPMIATKNSLRLKVVYDKNGYTIVSSNGIFVEPTAVTDSQIKLFKRDLLERPVIADVETTTDPLASTTSTLDAENSQSENADDLPF